MIKIAELKQSVIDIAIKFNKLPIVPIAQPGIAKFVKRRIKSTVEIPKAALETNTTQSTKSRAAIVSAKTAKAANTWVIKDPDIVLFP